MTVCMLRRHAAHVWWGGYCGYCDRPCRSFAGGAMSVAKLFCQNRGLKKRSFSPYFAWGQPKNHKVKLLFVWHEIKVLLPVQQGPYVNGPVSSWYFVLSPPCPPTSPQSSPFPCLCFSCSSVAGKSHLPHFLFPPGTQKNKQTFLAMKTRYLREC